MITFYCGVSETEWNHHPVQPGPFTCISPVYGGTERTHQVTHVSVPPDTQIIQDSGAFSDGPTQRLDFGEALERQIAHAERFRYTSQITHRASYDLLIDERWMNGVRSKIRWEPGDAAFASRMSVKAASYLTTHRYGIPCILSAQGVTPQQYLACARQIVPMMERQDIFGLGGWCILGKMPSLLPVFCKTMCLIIPFLAREQVKQVHIWGVCFDKALHIVSSLCNEYGMKLSTDSAGPTLKPCMGIWGYANWRDNTYKQPPILESCRSGEHHLCRGCRGLERTRHVACTRSWLETFQPTKPRWMDRPQQMSWLEEIA